MIMFEEKKKDNLFQKICSIRMNEKLREVGRYMSVR